MESMAEQGSYKRKQKVVRVKIERKKWSERNKCKVQERLIVKNLSLITWCWGQLISNKTTKIT